MLLAEDASLEAMIYIHTCVVKTLIYQSYSLQKDDNQEMFIPQSYLYLSQEETTPIYNGYPKGVNFPGSLIWLLKNFRILKLVIVQIFSYTLILANLVF